MTFSSAKVNIPDFYSFDNLNFENLILNSSDTQQILKEEYINPGVTFCYENSHIAYSSYFSSEDIVF